MGTKEKKSFKKYATKHLATAIENRRKGRLVKKEKFERIEKQKLKEEKGLKKEEADHLAQLDKLKEADPAFYSYLEEEDPNLLQFGQEDVEGNDEMEGSDAETEDDEDDQSDDGEVDEGPKGMKRINKTELNAAITAKNHGDCADMFMSAVRELGYTIREKAHPKSSRKFDDPALVKEIVLRVPQAIGVGLGSLLSKKDGTTSFKSHGTRHLVKRMLNGLISVISEGSNDGVLCAGLCQALTPFVPVFHLIKGITKQALKVVLSLCTHGEEPTRLAAYVVVRAMATRAAGTHSMYQSAAFKGIFVTLVRACHNYNSRNIGLIAFLMNCVVDLYGTDIEAAYQHAFVYIRQLAIYLRAALQQQSQSNIRAVFNWQFLLALRTWGLVVSTYAEPNQLGPLIHPVVQIAVGVMDLFCSPRMFPMHLHVLEMINHIASRAGVYVPVSTYLMRIISSASMSLDQSSKKRDAADANNEPVDLQFTMRIKKAQAKSQQYKVQVWNEALYLLTEHLALHSHSVGAPEGFWAVASTLRKLKRELKMPKINSFVSNILKNLEAGNKAIVQKREQGSFGPCDTTSIQQFENEVKHQGTPLASYYNTLRTQRVAGFAQKQKNAVARTTLDEVSDRRQQKRKRQ